MTNTVSGEELKNYVGKPLRASEWMTITQERIDQFADATDDHQFIHEEGEAVRSGPFGAPIAHGFLSLSLLSKLRPSDWPVLEGTKMVINYGLDKMRFLRPVKVDSRVRVHTKILSVREKRPQEFLIKTERTMEIEGEEKAAFIAVHLTLVIGTTA